MEDWILVIVVAVVCLFLLVGGMAKILGKCSRQEEASLTAASGGKREGVACAAVDKIEE